MENHTHRGTLYESDSKSIESLQSLGVKLETISHLVGHTTTRITGSRYLRVQDEACQDALSRFDQRFGVIWMSGTCPDCFLGFSHGYPSHNCTSWLLQIPEKFKRSSQGVPIMKLCQKVRKIKEKHRKPLSSRCLVEISGIEPLTSWMPSARFSRLRVFIHK